MIELIRCFVGDHADPARVGFRLVAKETARIALPNTMDELNHPLFLFELWDRAQVEHMSRRQNGSESFVEEKVMVFSPLHLVESFPPVSECLGGSADTITKIPGNRRPRSVE